MSDPVTPLDPARWSPFQGLNPFGEADSPFFYGREKETRLIAANLFAAPLTLLYGPSGVGKSSVLYAGVMPRLRQEPDVIVVACSAWQGDPVQGVLDAIRKACPDVPIPGSASMADVLTMCGQQRQRKLFLLLDQFEEYFTYHPSEGSVDAFTLEFSQAITLPDAAAHFLISIREDALAQLDAFEGHIPMLFENYFRLAHLDRRAATDAILKPVERYNHDRTESGKTFRVDPKLVERVLDEVKVGRIVIGQVEGLPIQLREKEKTNRVEAPYLQLVMTRLWDEEIKRNSTTLRLETLEAIGGSERIIRTHLDSTLQHLQPDQREAAAYILQYLVTRSGMKIALSAETLADFTGVALWRVESSVRELSDRKVRILKPVTGGTPEQSETWYEIFHDALAPAVLDWRARYFGHRTLLERLTRPLVYLAIAALVLQTLPQLAPATSLLLLLRGAGLLIFHAAAVSQLYHWFYSQVRPKVKLFSFLGVETRDMGWLPGLLLPILWYTSTEWQAGGLGAVSSLQYIEYLFTIVVTLAISVVSFYGGMQGAGQVTDRAGGHFETGFYGAYLVLCGLIVIVILLNLAGVILPWIAL